MKKKKPIPIAFRYYNYPGVLRGFYGVQVSSPYAIQEFIYKEAYAKAEEAGREN